MNTRIVLRDGTMEDARFLYECRNDKAARIASHHTEEISYESHLEWLRKSLYAPNCIIKIAEYAGKSVGVVRGNISDGVCCLSWMLDERARGQGLAKEMVRLFADDIPVSLRADVKVDNIASIKVAESAGMRIEGEEDGFLHFVRTIRK